MEGQTINETARATHGLFTPNGRFARTLSTSKTFLPKPRL